MWYFPRIGGIKVDEGKRDWNVKSTTDDHQRQLSERSLEEESSIFNTRMKKILDPMEPYIPMLNKIFLTSWVIAVLTDPLFFYIPTLNEDKKCLRMDKTLKIVALSLRSITDLFHLLHIIFQLLIGLMSKPSMNLKRKGLVQYALARARTIRWSYIIIDVLALLPITQVVILIFFSKMIEPGAGKLMLYMILLLQYVPRVLRIYYSCEELKKIPDPFTSTLWVRGAFNLFLYIIASHIIGAFWYFFSLQQQMECWRISCKNHIGCLTTLIDSCNNVGNTFSNLTSLNDFCPTNPPDEMVFDFGIFLKAIQSGIHGSTDFPKKFLQSFWWGLRNLSSFGSNLETSSRPWETCFAALISTLGLILFLYLIGNIQLYMQLATQRAEDKRYNKKVEIKKIVKAKEPDIELWASTHKLLEPEEVKTVIRNYMIDTLEKDKQLNFKELQKNLHSYLPQSNQPNQQIDEVAMGHLRIIHLKLEAIISRTKIQQWNNAEHTAQLWMSKNGIPRDIMPMIKKYVQHRLQNHQDDVDLVDLLFILPIELQRLIKQHLCLAILKKVSLLQNVDDEVLEEIIKHLRPVTYADNSYIVRKGEPIGYMLFITHGVVLIFDSANCINEKAKGDYFGDELVGWQLKSASFSDLPISSANVQSHTKVEGLALKAVDLKHVLSKYWWKIPISKKYELELLKRFAVNAIREAWQRSLMRRQKRDHAAAKWTAVNRKLKGVTALNGLG